MISSRKAELLGTVVEIQLPEADSGLFPDCFDEIRRIERTYSRFLPDSVLSHINREPGVWHDASGELISLLEASRRFREESGGCFDVTVKSALDSLGYDSERSFAPKRGAPAPSAGGAIDIDTEGGKVRIGKEVDFGGLGKGFALDRVAGILERGGVRHYCINMGGDLYARRGEGEDPWVVILEHPDDPSMAIGTVEIDGRSIAGSAPNRRRWRGGHHLIDAKSGRPASGVKAVFVTAGSGIEADAYATALFTAGFSEGIALSRRLPVELISISGAGKIYVSPGFGAELFR